MKHTHSQNWLNKIRRLFLLSFFDPKNQYQEKEINGFVLIKQFSQLLGDWEVAIYTKEAFQKRLAYKDRISQLLKTRGNKQERG
ncbi:MAG: hypothetical protein UU73_C0005G0025 [Candidatus Daviesbacteria bacterium GW2011_GWA1_41_61]|uniref:Uncharacterized protein n=1 Tax=Candidatus Daviesbacteria bacterium GW2011_GWA2_40_9 TaxID=1618424 RepID=A0A0G0U8T7_9BACT|nr:MAG: hypothetical protein UU26_C0012G0003 [Candidatus Daviesbacteria bacterium GW2011_GWC1_40_9]KKR83646.1 MAG: hypothetical protein UU29_C0003G0048 [Candidatus Daviesbacteria bacterium GW2011_GWA2_40_9]KKR92695.1 MAG: hypothetical protein UU44_C0005G0025 [Candidatus Daviesbacteria bacterium GW2011_GWB1_41_15]KKS14626.1 MAG: hypothetical protein UU73_C0005G0025 [Candidatus Daviesbacteria bacterium GW2011_GWA1_41_61]